MCLQQPTNLSRIGKFIQRPKYRPVNPSVKRLNRKIEKIIKKAIYKTCSPELAHEAINGYRRSEGKDSMAEKDFLRTDVPEHKIKRDFHYKRALKVIKKMFKPSRLLKPISFPDLRFYPWTLNVSAEAPFTIHKKWEEKIRQRQSEGEDIDGTLSFHNLYNEIFELNRHLIHQIKNKEPGFWNPDGTPKPYWFSTLHSRAHLVKTDDEDKLRAVFGVPKLLLMAENMFIWNLQKEYLNQKVQSPLLWGFETFRGGWMKLLTRLKSLKNNSFISGDWSGFDRFAPHEIIDDVHDIWRSYFTFEDGYEPTYSLQHPEGTRLGYPTSYTKPERLENLWTWMTYSIKHTPIRGFSGTLYQWNYNGIASGYQQTQLLDSFVNGIMLLTVLSEHGINIEGKDFVLLLLGDDNVSAFPERDIELYGQQFVEKISRSAKLRFNETLSVTKTTYGTTTNDIEILSYRNRNGIAYRDPANLLASLLYPERPRTLEATASACIGIATASMGCSHEVYNACYDAFHFLVYELKKSVDVQALRQYYSVRGIPLTSIQSISTDFPSYEETFAMNFSGIVRTEEDKQLLWPTKPTGTYGFYFLND
nr:RNA-dependent RNA polymerase [Sarcosphaera coronaria partitivirus]